MLTHPAPARRTTTPFHTTSRGRRQWVPRLTLTLAILASWGQVSAAPEEGPTYERHIRPIFRAHCFDCHGATEQVKGKLDLRLVRWMKQGGRHGPAIVPGKPEESYLLERIRNGEMPPGEKKVSAGEIQTIQRWIEAGAPTARPEPDTLGPGLGITAEERGFWSFQPILRPGVPDLSAFPKDARVRTPIDALILQAVPAGLGFSPDADRRTLIKRAYFDLVGLPPSPEEMRRWLTAPGEDWYDRLLSDLLASPAYGERWARHWLDVAGYADSEGYTVADAERPWAWKYRDWVVRALNEDRPFDRFITEQLAGDELAGPRTGDLTSEQIDLLTATGFLRMAADGTGSGADHAEARNQVVADTLKIVGTSLLGLSFQCAQCHDHRYDPILQTDYFALRAVFEPALDWKAWKVPDARRVSLYTAADREKAAEIEEEAQKIAAEKAGKQTEYLKQALEQELRKFDEPLRSQLRQAYETSDDKRTPGQKQLLAKHPSVNITPGVLYQYLPKAAEDLKGFDQRINEVRGRKPVEEFLRALVEPANHVPETKLFFRGDHQQPLRTVAPAPPTVLAPEGERPEFKPNEEAVATTGRRLAFARWLTGRDNPLFARVIVNRVWAHHFRRGLVATPADFGKLGTPPSHPQLLDWLADEFIRQGWSLKRLHRLILTSTVWRQGSEGPDPVGHPAFLRKPLLRLEAETIRDRMLAATGQLDQTLFGQPLGIQEDFTGQVVVEESRPRRSLYIQVRRSRPVALLQAFDAPVMETNCESRAHSTVATQSLMLLNGPFILGQAAALADRSRRESQPLASERRASIPKLAGVRAFGWQYGYGRFDEKADRTGAFTHLSHWTGGQWQGGPNLPDPSVGWAFLSADGGHPDVRERSVIRRWTAPHDGVMSIAGTLTHGSPGGDGVRGRIVSSRSGKVGEWAAHHGKSDTPVAEVAVKAGDTIDFITDSQANFTSDSFTWPVTITLRAPDRSDQAFSSRSQFRGPTEPLEALLGRVVRAWELALCRPPTDEELVLAAEFLARQLATLDAPDGRTVADQALTNLCQALLSCNEFLYVE